MKNLDLLIPRAAPVTDRFTWATITSTSPLLIRLDGETDALDLTPDCLVQSTRLAVGKRVWCQIYGRRVIILGQVGG